VRECEEIERRLGGSEALAALTGSRAYPRFTGPQIRKFARDDPEGYERTVRIHLVSSYLASVLLGAHAPVDHADASGMNLMDIRTRRWSDEALAATAPSLATRLPPLGASNAVVGTLSQQWRTELALPAVRVVAWSGDNPCSLVGTGLIIQGQLAVSLGTSDTIFGPMLEPRVSRDGTGHVFASPLGDYMGITVFRNGSLARERVRDQYGLDWAGFSLALRQTPAGNGGTGMLPWFEPEITPHVVTGQVVQFGPDGGAETREGADARVAVRALVEGQAIALARHSAWMGVVPRTIHATGGAGANREVLQVLADVFDADVYQFESTDSAALGAARLPWPDVIEGFVAPVPGSRLHPNSEHVPVYRRLREVYAVHEAAALARIRGA
jgi:xylulokinase